MLALLGRKDRQALTHEEIRAVKIDLTRASVKSLVHPRQDAGQHKHRSQSLLSELFRPFLQSYCSPDLQFRDKVAWCEVLSTWLTRACRCCSDAPDIIEDLRHTIQERDFQALFDSMLTDWDLGANIHTPLRDVFAKCLALQKILVPSHKEDHKALLAAALSMDQSQKSLYYAIEILRKALGTATILECEPKFFVLRLHNLQETSTATPLSRLLAAVMLHTLPEKASESEQLTWLRQWQTPVVDALSSKKSQLSSNLLTYLLPSLFQASKVAFNVFIRDLIARDPSMQDAEILRLTIDCLRKAKDVQVIGDIDSELVEDLKLSQNLLQTVMTHEDARIRVSAIDLLLAHPKPSTMFPAITYDILQDTIFSLFNETDMHCRKHTLDGVRAFFIRFQASLYNCKAIQKKAQLQNDQAKQILVTSYVERSESFAKWLKSLLKSNLEPGTGYQVTYMTLQMLLLAADFGWHGSAVIDRPKPNAFQSSKKAAFDKELPFSTNLFDHEMIRLLLDRLGDSFDDNRASALTLLSNLPSPLPGLERDEEIGLALKNALRLIQSTRGREGDGGARVLQFLYQRFVLTEKRAISFSATGLEESSALEIAFIDHFLSDIGHDCQQSHEAILDVAQTRPLHGRLIAIRYMIESIDYGALRDPSTYNSWLGLHDRILSTCSVIWASVREVLCDDSPEGNFPQSVDGSTHEALRGQEAQVILSFCWRALRETSELLRAVLAKAPFAKDRQFLSEKHFILAGQLSLSWLTEVRHRGAFSAVFPNFVEIARRLQCMRDHESLRQLPLHWMKENLRDLSLPHHSKDITRRSGGLPMSIISLMLSEVDSGSGQRELVDTAMKSLLDLVLSPIPEVNDKIELLQVHGYNTLKDIFLESKLAPYSIDYIEQCFILSIDGFSSPIWAIRNCALMLFSALVRRSFGSRTSRLESTTNTFSAAAFFHRYPKVLQRLIDELEVANKALLSKETQKVGTGLTPCLTLLSRLDRAEAAELEEDSKFEPVIRLLVSIATSQVWQVRSMAAKAIPTFIEEELVGSFIVQQLNDASTKDQNALHGQLLMIRNLLQYHLERHDKVSLFVEQVLSDFRRAITSRFVDFTSENPCATTEALWLRILLFLARSTNPKLNSALRQRGVDYCSRELAKPIEDKSKKLAIGMEERQEIMTAILMRALADPNFRKFQSSSLSAALIGLIEDERLSVRLTTYRRLNTIFSTSNTLKATSLHRALEAQSLKETWPIARIAARECLSQLPSVSLEYDESMRQTLLERYFGDLQHVKDGSPQTDIALKLVGRLMTCSNDVEISRYRALLTHFTQEDQSADTRKACLHSLQLSKLLDKSAEEEIIAKWFAILLDLLCDDDEDIRGATATTVCQSILHCPTTTPERTRAQLILHYAGQHDTSSAFQEVLVHEITRRGSPQDELLQVLQPSDLLFAVEKQNLWRNDVSNCQQALAGLVKVSVTPDNQSILGRWTCDGLSAIRQQVELHEADGPLGWTSIEDAWQMMRCTFSVANWLLRGETVPHDIQAPITDSLTALQQASAGKHLHPSFIKAISIAA